MLPIKLGNAQNIINHWSIIRTFDIQPLQSGLQYIKQKHIVLKDTMQNSTYGDTYTYELNNYQNLLKYHLNEAEKLMSQIIPSEETRKRRGLVNGLGTIWKSITGNLDQEDAERYNQAIEQLSTSQNNLKLMMEEQISLTEEAITKFSSTLQTIINNQFQLDTQLQQATEKMNQLEIKSDNTDNVLTIQMFLMQMISGTIAIKEILETLVNAITFAKLNTVHPSIIESIDLLNELNKIASLESKPHLPFDISHEKIYVYENIANVKSYYTPMQLVFIIEIPLTESDSYDYYHLYSIPIKHSNNSFHTIIPRQKYLILNERYFCTTNVPCQEASSAEYLCSPQSTQEVNHDSPCEVQLLKFSHKYENCIQHPVQMKYSKIQKIIGNQWILVFPRETVINKQCLHDRSKVALEGVYVVEIPDNCQIEIDQQIIRSYSNPIKKMMHLDLPEIKMEDMKLKKEANPMTAIKLDPINLDELHPIIHQMQHANEVLKKIEIPKIHMSLSIWTIILYVILVIVVFLFLCHYRTAVKAMMSRSKSRTPPADIHLEEINLKN